MTRLKAMRVCLVALLIASVVGCTQFESHEAIPAAVAWPVTYMAIVE